MNETKFEQKPTLKTKSETKSEPDVENKCNWFPKPSSFSNLTKVKFVSDEDPVGKESFLIDFVIKYKHAPSLYEMDDMGYPIGQIWYNIKRFRHSIYMSKLCKLPVLRDDYESYQRTHVKNKM